MGRNFLYIVVSFVVLASVKIKAQNLSNKNLTIKSKNDTAHKMRMLVRGKPIESYEFKIGQQFKLPQLTDFNGLVLDSVTLSKKIVVLNFWFIKCKPCRDELPELNKLYSVFKDNPKIVFVAICLDNRESIATFLKQISFKYHIIVNGKQMSNRYNVHLFPTNLIISNQGKVAYSAIGIFKDNAEKMQKIVSELLN